MSIGSLIGIGLGSYLPGENLAMNSMIGALAGNVIQNVGDKALGISQMILGKLFTGRYNTVTIERSDDNPIYLKIQKYIVNKHLKIMNKCLLEPYNGEIIFTIKDSRFKKAITDKFQNHKMTLQISTKKAKTESKESEESENCTISIFSKTAKVAIIKKFIERICQFKKDSKLLTIYRALQRSHSGKKDSKPTNSVYWNEVVSVNNKRISNTILSETNTKSIYDDVKWFINSADHYNKIGLPYKRGYLLHGIPGTGKTSIIKAVATEYKLNIFSIQMDIIENDSQFIKLFTSISEHTSNKPYILVLEDFDRSSIFRRYHEMKISMSTILNELDGVVESYGRILFITANDKSKFKHIDNIDALFRPGRIDVTCELSYCTSTQIQRIVKQFINVDMELSDIGDKKITPAQLISLLQKNMDNEEMIEEFKKKIGNSNLTALASSEENSLANLSAGTNTRVIAQRNSIISRRKRKIKQLESRVKNVEKQYEKIDSINEKINKEKELLEKSIVANKQKIARERKAKRLEAKRLKTNK